MTIKKDSRNLRLSFNEMQGNAGGLQTSDQIAINENNLITKQYEIRNSIIRSLTSLMKGRGYWHFPD